MSDGMIEGIILFLLAAHQAHDWWEIRRLRKIIVDLELGRHKHDCEEEIEV